MDSGLPAAAGHLTYDDAKAIEKNVDGIKYVAPGVQSSYQLVAGTKTGIRRSRA